MNIQTQTLRDFFRYAKHLKPSNLLPVYDFISLSIQNGKGKLMKSNIEAYVQMEFDTDQPDINILLEERVIKEYLSGKHEFITLSIDGNNVLVSDGVTPDTSFTAPKYELYPVFEYDAYTTTLITDDVIQRMKYASNMCLTPATWFGYVHFNNLGIMGTSDFGFIHYDLKTDSKLVLLPSHVAALSEFESVAHFQHKNFDCFMSCNVIFGFTQSSFNTPDYSAHIIRHADSFTISREALLGYCARTCAVLPDSKEITCSLYLENNLLTLAMNDAGKGKKNNFSIPVVAEGVTKKYFVAGNMKTLLSSIPYSELNMTIMQDRFIFSSPEDTSFYAVLMQARN